MIRQKSVLEGRFQDIIKKIGLSGAFGYKIIANKLVSLMKEENLTKTYAAFSMMDVKKTWCECSACKAAEEKYGAKSGGMLVTCDRIGKRITEKLAELGEKTTCAPENDKLSVTHSLSVALYDTSNLPARSAASMILSPFAPVTKILLTESGIFSKSSSKHSPLSLPPRIRSVSPETAASAAKVAETFVPLESLK